MMKKNVINNLWTEYMKQFQIVFNVKNIKLDDMIEWEHLCWGMGKKNFRRKVLTEHNSYYDTKTRFLKSYQVKMYLFSLLISLEKISNLNILTTNEH